jgi:hypothetical protein
MSDFVELNSDQRRETVNTRQRYQAWREAFERHDASRGSMVWSTTRGHDYLMRVAYDKQRQRRQKSLGPRSEATEQIKTDFERARAETNRRLQTIEPIIARQAAINRALGLGRVPLIGARIIRAIDAAGLLGAGIRVLGTNAIYAFEAAAAAHIEAGLTTTEDVDLLLDSRARLSFVTSEDLEEASLLRILKRVDKSFSLSRESFRAVNDEGYLVDLIKPLRNPPWAAEETRIGNDPEDLSAVEIAGLTWHESAPAFEAVAIDERGAPLRIVTSDPRVFAAHKYWMSKRGDREPVKQRRDLAQARVVAKLVASHMPHLRFTLDELRMLPRELVVETMPLFQESSGENERIFRS